MVIDAMAVGLAMGCRERTRGALAIPGDRPAGIFTAGAAQRLINMDGVMVGKKVVILGSGDIGLIMARRLTLEGAQVLACLEVQPYPSGLARNIAQCLEDFAIPLYLSHTVVDIVGRNRVEKVVAARVDEKRNPIPGTEFDIPCDTLLLSVGLIPENELSRQAGVLLDSRTGGPEVYENMETGIEGIFACGNVVHVHDIVDFVTLESQRAGKAAAAYALGQYAGGEIVEVSAGRNVSYTVPEHIRRKNVGEGVELFFRVKQVMENSRIVVESEGRQVARFRREHMAPGEMERISLPAALWKTIGNRMEVRVEEERTCGK